MFHMTTINDDRIRDLRDTADELRFSRTAVPDGRRGLARELRLRLGVALLTAGTVLVSGTRSATPSRAGR